MMQTVLVTGGAGYVGSHACKGLAAAGFVPVTLDDLSAGHDWAVRWGPLVRGDVGDRTLLAGILAEHRPVAVLHFAGSIAVGESMTAPLRYYRNNVANTLVLLEAMQGAGVNHVVFSSSAAVYGDPQTTPLTEDHPCQPVSPYGWTKLMVERVLADLAKAHDLRSVSLRYFNASGADLAAEIGEAHAPETHLIPRVLDVALSRASAIEIYGGDHPTPDGTCLRDYVHVSDLADAHVAALRYLLDGGRTAVFNLGNAKAVSVREVIEVARRVTGHPVPVRSAPHRAGDPAVLVADARRAHETLSWQPKYPSIERIVEDAWRWHSTHFAS